MSSTETINDLLHENWIWFAIIAFLLVTLRQGTDSLRNSILQMREQTERTRQSVECLSSIDDNLRRIEKRMKRSEKQREERERLRKRQKQIGSEKLRWHEPPEPPARNSCHERLQKLNDFIEHCGGYVEISDIPSEVMFILPEENAATIIEAFDEIGSIGGGGPVQVKATGATLNSPARPAWMGRSYTIDLFSIDDDQLEAITRP